MQTKNINTKTTSAGSTFAEISKILVTPIELVALLWTMGIESIVGIDNPFEDTNYSAQQSEDMCAKAIKSIENKGYIYKFAKNAFNVRIPVAKMLTCMVNAEKILILESGINKDIKVGVYCSISGGNVMMLYSENNYFIFPITDLKVAVNAIFKTLMGDGRPKNKDINREISLNRQALKKWRAYCDNGIKEQAIKTLLEQKLASNWAKQLTETLMNPFFRGSVQHYEVLQSSESLAECYSLLLGNDGFSLEIENKDISTSTVRLMSNNNSIRKIVLSVQKMFM